MGKVLVLFQARGSDERISLREGIAFAAEKVGLASTFIDYRQGLTESSFLDLMRGALRQEVTHLLVFAVPTGFEEQILVAVEELGSSKPKVITYVGDGFGPGAKKLETSAWKLLGASDVCFLTSMGVFGDQVKRNGAGHVGWLPHVVEDPVVPSSLTRIQDQIAVVANAYPTRRVGSHLWRVRRGRLKAVKDLKSLWPGPVEVHGAGWGSKYGCNGALAFGDDYLAYARSGWCFEPPPGSKVEGYHSDRPFRAASQGALLITQQVSGVDALFEHGRELWFYEDLPALAREVAMGLDMSESRRRLQERMASASPAARWRYALEVAILGREVRPTFLVRPLARHKYWI